MKFLSYEDAKKITSQLNLETIQDWKNYLKSNKLIGIPKQPSISYKDKGWISWDDFLGHSKNYLDFNSAKIEIKKLNIKNYKDWTNRLDQLPNSIPKYPAYVYQKEWKGWKDFLGNEFIDYNQAKGLVKKFKIKTVRDWRSAIRNGLIPEVCPKHPELYYKDHGWTSWKDFLFNKIENKLSTIKSRIKKVEDHYELGKLKIYPELGIIKGGNSWTNQNYTLYHISKDLGSLAVHRLVFLCLHDIPEGFEIDHIDNDPTNNKIDNLQILSHEEHRAKTAVAQYFKHRDKIDFQKIYFYDEVLKKKIKIKKFEYEVLE